MKIYYPDILDQDGQLSKAAAASALHSKFSTKISTKFSTRVPEPVNIYVCSQKQRSHSQTYGTLPTYEGDGPRWYSSGGRPDSVAPEFSSWRQTKVKISPPKDGEN